MIIIFDDTFSFIENIDSKYQFEDIYISLDSKLEWAGGADRVNALILYKFSTGCNPVKDRKTWSSTLILLYPLAVLTPQGDTHSWV